MISLVIGLILIGGVIQIYLASRATSRAERGVSQVQETGRFAFAFLGPDIRMAGYQGCSRGNPRASLTNILNHSDNYPYRFEIGTGIRGFDTAPGSTSWSPGLAGSVASGLDGLTHPPVHGTDAVTVRVPYGTSARLIDPINKTSTSMKVETSNSGAFDAGDIAMISDCVQSTVFQVSGYNASSDTISYAATSGTPGNARTDWGAYQPGASVDKFHTVSYFIASRTDKARDCSNHDCGLWKKVGADNAVELAPGVENLQILYGVDTNNDGVPNQYVTADNALLGTDTAHDNWMQVVAVKTALLVVSRSKTANGATPSKQTYTLLDKTVQTHDRRLRQVFKQTFTLRNRM